MSDSQAAGYAGDVTAKAAWDALSSISDSILIDVRTAAEWIYVGVPVLAEIGKETILIEWDQFPTGDLVPDFPGRLRDELDKVGAGTTAPLYFICRSGSRSRKAAIAATELGYARSYNVESGFEGRLSPDRHRQTPGSWKAEGLPWAQS